MRTIALGRYIHLLKPENARNFLATITTDEPGRVSVRQLPWLVELSLPGLVSSLAESQLFGHEKGAYTGAQQTREGIFKLADSGRESERGSRGTFGVVFLDEIGDLDPTLQPKLLAALSGGEVTRLGGEGREGFVYKGLTIGATWRELTSLRRDLRERLSDHVLFTPSLSELRNDLDTYLDVVISEVKAAESDWLTRVLVAQVDGFDRQRIEERHQRIQGFSLSADERSVLESADWSTLGELRGLSQVLRHVMLTGQPINAVIAGIKPTPSAAAQVPIVQQFLDELLRTPIGSSKTLANHCNTVYAQLRSALADILKHDPELTRSLADHLGIQPNELTRRLSDLKRRSALP
ncbi:sigma 54-interacting transcriptional regulator [Archangium sp.]|uniref:sigma 54-interacting transcriptional regulator n=1 Tax=Archangium sp. TaxID=1872627 RepID=UPI00389A516E